MDNGFLLFNKVRVPHVAMLARFSRVDPETSQYIRPAASTLVYGTMTWVRSTIVMQAGAVLARGVTIATRYCAVRRQFQDKDAGSPKSENQVLNYTTVQIRLLTLLATTFALHFTGQSMMKLYEANQQRMTQDVGKMGSTKRNPGPEETYAGSDLAADLHATSCGLKSLASTIAVDGLEVCRRACGGHGYSSFSGIGSWYADYLPTATWEGDNLVVVQQTARYVSITFSSSRYYHQLINLALTSYSNQHATFSKATNPLTTQHSSSRTLSTNPTWEQRLTFSVKTKISSQLLHGEVPF